MSAHARLPPRITRRQAGKPILATHQTAMNLAALQCLAATGESETLEFKKSTAVLLKRFEPLAPIAISRVDVGSGRIVIVLDAPLAKAHIPFTFEGRAYRRIGSTTTVMAQEEYGRLPLDRNHSRYR